MPDDLSYMQRALELAGRGRLTVSPNPMVGCVIVKNGKIIAESWHQVYGGDHAEVAALKQAGHKARGAVMYVTLEPCAHWGKTPPCVDALITAGIKRVVIAMTDPNPLTNGASVAKLKSVGIDVMVGVGEKDSAALNSAFIKYITKKLPFVTLKSAQTLDGRISTRTGDSKWITSDETRAFARVKRNGFDAILVGINTVLADDPRLDAPDRQIRKVVLDSALRVPEKALLFKGVERDQVIIAVTARAPLARIRRFEARGACVLVCPEKNKRPDLKFLFKELARQKVARILIEGGAAIAGSAIKAGLVDELHVYIAPKLIGDVQARPTVVGLDTLKLSRAASFSLTAVERIGDDVFLQLKR